MNFVPIDQLVLPPPLPAIVTTLLVLGLLSLSKHLAGRDSDPLARALHGVGVVAVGAGAMHAAALVGAWSLTLFRVAGGALAVVGIASLPALSAALRARLRAWRTQGSLRTRADTLADVVATLVAVLLFVSTLGPATDGDSLDYHLGVPLDWLLHGRAYARPDWLHARLVGIAETWSGLGLACGTDGLGASLQWYGAWLAASALSAIGVADSRRRVARLFVWALPLCLSLVPSQKPMMLPSAALLVALVAIVTAPARASRAPRETALVAVAVGFAAACKYSYVFPAAIVALVAIESAWRTQRTGAVSASLLGAAAFLPAQVFARNAWFYRDPVSPFLEHALHHDDPALVAFAHYLRTYEGEHSLARIVRLPFDLIVPPAPGLYAIVMAAGGLVLFTVPWFLRGISSRFAIASLAAAVAQLVFGQLGARFFLDSYLWAAAAFVAGASARPVCVATQVLTAQGLVTALIAGVVVAVGAPGALTPALRDRVMLRTALGWEEMRWTDAMLPPGTVMTTFDRVHALYPRPSIGIDRFDTRYPLAERERRMCHAVRDDGLRAITRGPGTDSPPIDHVRGVRITSRTLHESPMPHRNPLVHSTYSLELVRVEPTSEPCP